MPSFYFDFRTGVVPISDEMTDQVIHNHASQPQSNIMPGHPGNIPLQMLLLKLLNILDLLLPLIGILNARKHIALIVKQRVRRIIIATIRQIQPTSKRHPLIHNDHLLMVRPHKRQHSLRMPNDLDVGVQLLQSLGGVFRVVVEHSGLLVEDDVDFDAPARCGVQDAVEAVLLGERGYGAD
jgi:hypothetical protein